ncbi:MAG: hypothetical protein IT435_12545 [Phycisphaerales bacterium]|nr:hypothetical protein [Phycisphaerales bacterium]
MTQHAPQLAPNQPLRSKAAGKAATTAGTVILIIACIVILTAGTGGLFLCALPLLIPVTALLWWGKRLGAPTVQELTAQDPRPPVVYLRSFKIDDQVDHTDQLKYNAILPAAVADQIERIARSPALKQMRKMGGYTVENKLVEQLSRLGPVIAIGDPTETSPLPGAARMYLGDEWQSRIIAEMRRAALIVIRPWTSDSVLREINFALDNCGDPSRVILIFWEIADDDYEKIRQLAAARQISLPATKDRAGREMIRFDSAKQPRFEHINQRGFLGTLSEGRTNLQAFADSLADEFGYRRNGNSYTPPRS